LLIERQEPFAFLHSIDARSWLESLARGLQVRPQECADILLQRHETLRWREAMPPVCARIACPFARVTVGNH
jgi:hypothetical protein